MQHNGPIASVAAGGPYVATAGYDNQLILWHGQSGQAVARACHDHLINHCGFSSDGTMVATASSDYSARVWEVPSLRLRAVLLGHEDDVDMAAFSPDDRLIATCALDRTIRIFDVAGHCLTVMRGHVGNILAIAWSVDGRRLVSASVDGTVREWEPSSGSEIRCSDLGIRTDSLVLDRHGRIFAGDDAGRIAVIDGDAVCFVPAHRAGVKKLVLDQALGVLISLSYDRTMAVWAIGEDGSLGEIARSEFPAMVWARAAAVIGPGRIAVGTFGARFGVFDWNDGRWDMGGVAAGPAFNAVTVVDGDDYAIGDAGILYRNGRAASEVGSLCNFLVAGGDRLLTGGQLGQLFDANSGTVLYSHDSPLNCGTAFLREGVPHVAIGTYTGEAVILACPPGERPRPIRTLKIYDNAIKGLVATGSHLFSVCASTAIAWHALDDFREVRRQDNAHERIANGCCLAGGDAIATVGRDRTLRIWAGSRQEVYQTPHPNSVKCVCASDDGGTLMTGAYTGTVAAFDMATRQWRPMIRPTAAGISSLAFDRRRQCFLAASFDGRVYEIAQVSS